MPGAFPLFRVVVDTNIFIRGILSTTGASAEIVDTIFRRQCLLISSRQHLSEIHRILTISIFNWFKREIWLNYWRPTNKMNPEHL
jgi:putative PIN family toxin of toxin-antitoxin system